MYTFDTEVEELGASPPHGAKPKLETLHRIFTGKLRSEIMVDEVAYLGLGYSFAFDTVVVSHGLCECRAA